MADEETTGMDKKLRKYDSRGVQTLFRTMSRNHYNLLRMVDNKAGIIITMNSIIISLAVGALYVGADVTRKGIESIQIQFLIYFSIASMTVAVISMLPYRYMGRRFRASSYKGSLYAQNYSDLTLEEFKADFFHIIETGSHLYEEMINDLYFLGRFIAFKQKLVMASFIIFLCGLLGSALIPS
jgi:hypothetical protein